MAVKVASFRLTRGFFTDTPAGLAPADGWTSGSNFLFRYGVAKRIFGMTAESSILEPTGTKDIRHFVQREVLSNSAGFAQSYTMVGLQIDPSWKVKVCNDLTVNDATPAVMINSGPYVTSTKFAEQFVVFSTYLDPPCYLPTTLPAVTLPGWGPSGSAFDHTMCIRAWKDHLLALSLYDATAGNWKPTGVYWSSAGSATAVPTQWVPAATNLAGNAFLGGPGGVIWDGLPLRDSFLIYRRNAIWLMERETDDVVFSFRSLFEGIGAAGINCVASDGQSHYCFTGRDLIRTDGARWESLLYGKIRSLLPTNDGLSYQYRNRVFYRPDDNEVWACFTLGTGSPQQNSTLDQAIVYNCSTGDVALRDFPSGHFWFDYVYSMGDSPEKGETWGYTAANGWLRVNVGTTNYGSSITASITRDHLDFGQPERRKLVQWVRPIIYPASGSPVISCEVGARDTLGGTPSYSAAVNFTHGTSDKVDTFASGRFLSFRFGSTGDYDYSIAGFDVGYELEGEY